MNIRNANNTINFGAGAVAIPTFIIAFDAIYDDLYKNDSCATEYVARAFDDKIKNDATFQMAVDKFNDFRNDFISSDREAAAFLMAYDGFANTMPVVASFALLNHFAA